MMNFDFVEFECLKIEEYRRTVVELVENDISADFEPVIEQVHKCVFEHKYVVECLVDF